MILSVREIWFLTVVREHKLILKNQNVSSFLITSFMHDIFIKFENFHYEMEVNLKKKRYRFGTLSC